MQLHLLPCKIIFYFLSLSWHCLNFLLLHFSCTWNNYLTNLSIVMIKTILILLLLKQKTEREKVKDFVKAQPESEHCNPCNSIYNLHYSTFGSLGYRKWKMGNKRPQACPTHRTHALHNPQSRHSGSCKHHFQGRHYARQNVISHFTISRTGAANMSLAEDGARGKGKVPKLQKSSPPFGWDEVTVLQQAALLPNSNAAQISFRISLKTSQVQDNKALALQEAALI